MQIDNDMRERSIIWSIKMDNTITLKWLLLSYNGQQNLCEIAAAFGSFKCLLYLCFMNYELGNSCEIAARNGHLKCLRVAHENGGIWGNSCNAAADRGKIKCLKYAFEEGCPWNICVSKYLLKHNDNMNKLGFLDCYNFAKQIKYGGNIV